MNFFIISLLDLIAEKNITAFCNINFVKSALLFSDIEELSMGLKRFADYYVSFLKKIEFLPVETSMNEYIGHYDMTNTRYNETTVNQAFTSLNLKNIVRNDLMPIYLRYTDFDHIHLVSGIAIFENQKQGFLHLVDFCIPREMIRKVSSHVDYVKEIFDSYTTGENGTLRQWIESKGYNYNQFQRDCKTYLGDSFYSFQLKVKIIEAVRDIVFTSSSLKEIAFKNNFRDYANMYKTFVSHGLNIKSIPRFANS